MRKKKQDPIWMEKWKSYQKEYKSKHDREYGHTKLRFKILLRDNFTCQYCGQKAPNVILHVDHILPSSKGGKTTEDNLRTACEDCNLGKSNHLITK